MAIGASAVTLRFRLPPGDIPPEAAARHMGMTRQAFEAALPVLLGRGFPPADPTTGNYCLEAIDAWRLGRYPQQFPDSLTASGGAHDAKSAVRERIRRWAT